MSRFCLDCTKRSTCKEICPELAEELKKVTVSRRGGKFTTVDPNIIDRYKYKSKERGRRITPKIYNDNWETD